MVKFLNKVGFTEFEFSDFWRINIAREETWKFYFYL